MLIINLFSHLNLFHVSFGEKFCKMLNLKNNSYKVKNILYSSQVLQIHTKILGKFIMYFFNFKKFTFTNKFSTLFFFLLQEKEKTPRLSNKTRINVAHPRPENSNNIIPYDLGEFY